MPLGLKRDEALLAEDMVLPSALSSMTPVEHPLGAVCEVEQEVLVRKIAAVETLGSASVICSDKTGTLTEGRLCRLCLSSEWGPRSLLGLLLLFAGKMTMVGMYAAGVTYEVTGKGFDPEALLREHSLAAMTRQSLEAVESHGEFHRWVKCSDWDRHRTLAKTWAAR